MYIRGFFSRETPYTPVPLIPIPSLDDPRAAPYRNLKDRDLARDGDRFIAESEQLVRRLLASNIKTESILTADKRLPDLAPILPRDLPVYVAPATMVNQIVGFKFHSGVMAVGVRPKSPTLDDILKDNPRATLVVCPEVEKTDNLGALIRIAAAFGADAMILGPHSCDPFFRQSVRVSMGTVFHLPIVRSDDLARDLHRLRDEFAVELIATVLDENAQPLDRATRGPKLALLLGNEAQGLPPDVIGLCDRRITLPMQLGTDSLNVAVAAAVFLYHFTRVTP
jgi:tRNA G18 (ribose-2'-O)-methylase SpoU